MSELFGVCFILKVKYLYWLVYYWWFLYLRNNLFIYQCIATVMFCLVLFSLSLIVWVLLHCLLSWFLISFLHLCFVLLIIIPVYISPQISLLSVLRVLQCSFKQVSLFLLIILRHASYLVYNTQLRNRTPNLKHGYSSSIYCHLPYRCSFD